MKKKSRILWIIVVILLILLIPIPVRLKDGGSIEYKAIIYTYTKIHRLNETSQTGYEEGWELKIFGIQVGGNMNPYKEKEPLQSDFIKLKVKENTLTSKGATFIIQNNTEEEYSYGEPYVLEKFEKNNWVEMKTLDGEPLSWNAILYRLKPKEEREIPIDWSIGYGKLERGTYRISKHDLRKSMSHESRSYSISVEFDI